MIVRVANKQERMIFKLLFVIAFLVTFSVVFTIIVILGSFFET